MQISPERTDQAKLRSNWQWSKFSQSMNILTNKDQIDCANFRHIQLKSQVQSGWQTRLKGQVQSGKQTLLKGQVQSGWQTLLKSQVQSGWQTLLKSQVPVWLK